MEPLKGKELDTLFLKYMDKSETFRNTVSFISYLNIIFGWDLEEKDGRSCKKNSIGVFHPKENDEGNVMASFEDKSELLTHENDLVQELNDKDEDLMTEISHEEASKEELKSETCDSTSHEVCKAKFQNVSYEKDGISMTIGSFDGTSKIDASNDMVEITNALSEEEYVGVPKSEILMHEADVDQKPSNENFEEEALRGFDQPWRQCSKV